MVGTFFSALRLFYQRYEIRALIGETATTYVICVTFRNKSQDKYEELLRSILCESLKSFVLLINCDNRFEQAVSFDQLEVYLVNKGDCRGACIIKEIFAAALYRTDDNVKLFCGMLDGFAFPPNNDVIFLKTNIPQGLDELCC